jgi:two-component system, cell cycle response regulator
MSARVLVVDDIEQNRKLLQDKLKNEYFHVITAVDGWTPSTRRWPRNPMSF